jgi:hypothetical protein
MHADHSTDLAAGQPGMLVELVRNRREEAGCHCCTGHEPITALTKKRCADEPKTSQCINIPASRTRMAGRAYQLPSAGICGTWRERQGDVLNNGRAIPHLRALVALHTWCISKSKGSSTFLNADSSTPRWFGM